MNAVVAIRRNPFSRETLVRRVVKTCDACDCCGNSRRDGKALFEYGTERDGVSQSYIGPHWHPGWFCSIACHDHYHLR
jgi:hypothetical protein